jgi:hypothetical protein
MADKYGLTVEEIKSIISAPYSFIAKKTRELIFEDGLTREEFDKKKTNFNIPSIGKLFASNYLYNEIQKKKNKKKLG